MAIDRARTLRGALAGAVAAGLWAAQQPLDKRAFGSQYDDVLERIGALERQLDADETVCLQRSLLHGAVGASYADFAQLEDAEVTRLLDAAG